MNPGRFTEQQIIRILREQEGWEEDRRGLPQARQSPAYSVFERSGYRFA